MASIHLRKLPDPLSTKPPEEAFFGTEVSPYDILLKHYKKARFLKFRAGEDHRGRQFVGKLIFIPQGISPGDIEGAVFYKCLMFGNLPKSSNVTQIECVHRPYPEDISIRDIPLIREIAIAGGNKDVRFPPYKATFTKGFDLRNMQILNPVSNFEDLYSSVFDGSKIDGWMCYETMLRSCSFEYAEVSNSKFAVTTFEHGVFSDACFIDCTFDYCDFRDCEFAGASFLRCEFTNCKFKDARLDKSDFKTSKASWPDIAKIEQMQESGLALNLAPDWKSVYGIDLWKSRVTEKS